MNNKTKYIFTDIHGNYLTLLKLIDKVALENNIDKKEVISNMVICGDLEDRGPRSKQIIQFCIDNKVDVVMGNHELMMIDQGLASASYYIKNRWFGDDLWTLNGGDSTMESYIVDKDVDLNTLHDHIEWMKTLPYYIEFKDIEDSSGRYLVCSHSQIHNVWEMRGYREEYTSKLKEFNDILDNLQLKDRLLWKKSSEGKGLSTRLNTIKQWANSFEENIVWGRPNKIKDAGEIYNVHGHTPQKDGARVKTIYSNIDTGCFYKGEKGYYKLTCLQFPEMKLTTQENIDND